MQEQTILEDIIGSQNGLSTNKVLDKILLMCYVEASLVENTSHSQLNLVIAQSRVCRSN